MQPAAGSWLVALLVVGSAITTCCKADDVSFAEQNAVGMKKDDLVAEQQLEHELQQATENAETTEDTDKTNGFFGTSEDDETDALSEADQSQGDPSKEPKDASQTYSDWDSQTYEKEEDATESDNEQEIYEQEEDAIDSDNKAEEGAENKQPGVLDETGDLVYSPADNEENIEMYAEEEESYPNSLDDATSQVMREPLVGVGYHVINGNPDGSFLDGGRDPGLLRTRRIMRLTYTDGKSTNLRGTRQRVADQVSFVRVDSCSTSKVTKLIYGVQSYRNKLSSYVSSSYRSGYSSWYYWWCK